MAVHGRFATFAELYARYYVLFEKSMHNHYAG